jgi:outer membrane protein OmpA-like peptidoglycan-associated protein
MKINYLLIFFWFGFLLVSSPILASEKSVYGFVGGGLGYSHLLSSKDNEQTKTGYRLNLSGFLSYRHDTAIWDFGGGWMLNRLKNDGEKKIVTSVGDVNDQRDLEIETRAGFLRLARRVQIWDAFEVGVGLESLIGPSLSFSQNDKSGTPKFFFGPEVAYIVPSKDGRWQFGAQLGTDLNLKNRQLFFPLLSVHYGIPLYQTNQESPRPESIPPLVAAPSADKVEFVISGEFFNFNTSSSKVDGNLESFLKILASEIVRQSDNWRELRIDGHTDSRGKIAYNIKLSEERAQVVVKALLSAGLPRHKVSGKGFGPSMPVDPSDTPEAHAKNRRVELTFLGVKDKDSLVKIINQVKVNTLGGAPLQLRLKEIPGR